MQIKTITLQSADIAATVVFYQDVLGIPVQEYENDRLSLQIGSTLVQFNAAATGRPVYHLAFDIPHNQLEAAYEWLRQKTEVLPVAPGTVFSEFERWNARSIYCYDNNGNILELICRLDLDNAADASFDAGALLHVSEVGIVCSDVPQYVQVLQQQYDLPVYAKQPPADNFTVLGDEEGLFVLVSEGRHWFPTTIAAAAFPLEITFDQGDGAIATLRPGIPA
ncbi:VOC family protein [Taibaiella chishuiensis]|uniref:Catechol-2,3-dioxygenase n=1 Tax=Taibaiella chishuiensis TaxID=1434707 RepID=A0A2P8CXR0_9BACT|nr:VOC family protein [Taibaiella chishuiensis]PSK89764.1 catechol-2,3-dioxygenase [Taibaiella chishuiensis]